MVSCMDSENRMFLERIEFVVYCESKVGRRPLGWRRSVDVIVECCMAEHSASSVSAILAELEAYESYVLFVCMNSASN